MDPNRACVIVVFFFGGGEGGRRGSVVSGVWEWCGLGGGFCWLFFPSQADSGGLKLKSNQTDPRTHAPKKRHTN